MKASPVKVLLFVFLAWITLSGAVAADDVVVSGSVAFSALDGSADDHDGLVNGVFTVADGNLVIDGTVHCNDDPPLPGSASACPIRISVSGDLILEAGGAIQAENRSGGGNGGNITLGAGGDLIFHGPSGLLPGAVVSSGSLTGSGAAGAISATAGGAVEIEAGSTLSASSSGGSAGAVGVEAGGTIRVAGLVASGPGTSLLASRWTGAVLGGGSSGQKGGAILLRSTSADEPGIRIEATGTVASQGQGSGPQLVLLEACGIEVHGLVAAVSKNDTPARIALRSGKGILVDGTDLAAGSGSHLGRVRADSTAGGAATHVVDLFAEADVQTLGPTSGTTDLFAVSANPGEQAQRTGGSVSAISLSGALAASGNAFDAGRALSGNKGGKIDLRSAGDAILEDAHLRAVGGYLTASGSRRGGQISVRSYSGEVRWIFGTGDVRPTGSGTSASSRGTITLTACAGIDTTGTAFPVLGSPVAPFPVELDGVCSPAAPSLPSGESPLPVCNEPPVARDDAFTTAEDTQLSGGNVLADNGSGADSDVNGDTLTVNTTPVSGPSNGTLTLNADGTFTYDPDLDFNGTDTFEYEVSDGNGGTDVGLVTITVTPENDAPAAQDDAFTTAEDTQLSGGNVLADNGSGADSDVDGDTLTVNPVPVSGPSNGTLTLNADGTFIFDPDLDFNGMDTFEYEVLDGNGGTDVGLVTITVTSGNDAPVARDDLFTTAEDTPLTSGNVLADNGSGADSDVDDDTLTVNPIPVSEPSNGTLTLNADGTFTYGPNLNFNGADAFQYQVLDGNGGADIGLVSITVTAVNDPPVANPDAADITEEAPNVAAANSVSGNVLTNDTDPDNSLMVNAVAGGSMGSPRAGTYGSVTINSDGSFTYILDDTNPAVNALAPGGTLTEAFGYTASDGSLTSSSTLTVTIHGADDPPTPDDDAFDFIGNTQLEVDQETSSTPEALATTPSAFGVLDGDVDPDGGGAVLVSGIVGCGDVSEPFDCNLAGQGTISLSGNGRFSFVPEPGDTDLTATFQYTLAGNPNPATVTLTRFERVWYVKNDDGGGTGVSNDPFATLAEAQAASVTGDYIFVHFGDGTSTNQAEGIVLKNGQHLIGEHAGLAVQVLGPGTFNGAPLPTAVDLATPAPGNRPLIDHSGGGNNAVSATDAIPLEIVGLSLMSVDANAIDLTNSGALPSNAALSIGDNIIRGAGAEGIDINLNSDTTGTLTLNVTGNSWDPAGTHTGNAVDINRAAGTLNLNFSGNANIKSNNTVGAAVLINGGSAVSTTITGFSGNSISGDTLGAGVVISNATFDAVPGGVVQQVDGGNLAIGAFGNPVGTGGMSLATSLGNLFFDDLDIFAGTSGLIINGAMSFAVTPASPDGIGTSTIDSDDGAAVDIASATLDLRLADLESNTSVAGVSLNAIGANSQFRAPSGSSITKSSGSGTAFSVASSGTGTTVSYGGILNVTSGSGVSLTSNTGSTIGFTGALTLNTGANPAFSATGGGTVTATEPTSTLMTSSGTALNVSDTTIGALGLKFRSISSGTGGSPASGIVLNNSGTGALTVSGTGNAGSGGTIQSTTSDGIRLTNAHNVSLSYMNLTNIASGVTNGTCHFENVVGCEAAIDMSGVSNIVLDDLVIDHNDAGHIGIAGNNVNGLSLTDSSVLDVGDSDAESAILLQQLTGTVLLEDLMIDDPVEYGVRVFQPTGSGTVNLTLRRVTVQNNINTFGEAGFSIRAAGGTSRLLIDDCDFLNTDGPGVDGQTINAAVLHMTVQGSTFTENRALPMAINFVTDNTSQGFVKISNNSVTDCATAADCSIAFDLDANRTSTLHAIVTNNTVSSGAGIGTGMEFIVGDGATGRAEVRDNNFAMPAGEVGMTFQARSEGFGGTNGRLDVTFEGNTISGIQDAGLFTPGVQFLAGASAGTHDQDVCVNTAISASAGGNTVTGTNNPGFTPRFEVAQRTGTVFILQGFVGTGTNAASVGSHFDTNNNATTLDPTFVRSTGTAVVNYTSGTCNTPTTPTLP